MGVGYFQLGDYQSSIKSFQESLKLSPHHADVHTNIATAHIKLNNNLQEALNHLQAAANIAPQDAEIQVNIQNILVGGGSQRFWIFAPQLTNLTNSLGHFDSSTWE